MYWVYLSDKNSSLFLFYVSLVYQNPPAYSFTECLLTREIEENIIILEGSVLNTITLFGSVVFF